MSKPHALLTATNFKLNLLLLEYIAHRLDAGKPLTAAQQARLAAARNSVVSTLGK
jgi:hypothetical protein